MIGRLIPPTLLSTVGRTATVAGATLGPLMVASQLPKTIMNTARKTNLLYSPQVHGYGKRGTDANRLNTSNLVQGLHNSRRKNR